MDNSNPGHCFFQVSIFIASKINSTCTVFVEYPFLIFIDKTFTGKGAVIIFSISEGGGSGEGVISEI